MQQALVDGYTRVDTHGRHAVLAVGPQLMMANAAMQTLLGAADQEVLQEHVRFLMHHRSGVDERVDLPSGARVRLRGTAIAVGDDVAGMVVTVALTKPDDDVRTAGTPPSGPTPGAASGCPAWRAAATTVQAALRSGEPVLVLGERGAGRFRLLADVFGGVHEHAHTAGIPAEAIERDPHGIAERLLRVSSRPVLRVLRTAGRATSASSPRR